MSKILEEQKKFTINLITSFVPLMIIALLLWIAPSIVSEQVTQQNINIVIVFLVISNLFLLVKNKDYIQTFYYLKCKKLNGFKESFHEQKTPRNIKENISKTIPQSLEAYNLMLLGEPKFTFEEIKAISNVFHLPLYLTFGSYKLYVANTLTEYQANYLIRETVIFITSNKNKSSTLEEQISIVIEHISSNKDSAKALENDIPELTEIRKKMSDKSKIFINAHQTTHAIEDAFATIKTQEEAVVNTDNEVSDFGDNSFKI